jgi:hypothetical protein
MYVGLLFLQPDIDILLCESVARPKCTGSHCLCHARWLSRRRLACQLRGRPDRPQKDRYPFRYCVGHRLRIAMCRRGMHLRSSFQAYPEPSHRTAAC